MAYDKSGRAPDGSIDPTRRLVAGIMHLSSIGSGSSGVDWRKKADDLYQTMVTGKSHGDWKFKGSKEKKDDDEGAPVAGGIKDVDYSGTGERVNKVPRVGSRLAAKESSNMKEGGLVRGAGCAQRGRGRGKMV
jgi:hypothetical protein